RFFIYDLKNDRIINSGLVAHGSCNNYFLENVWFSNLPGCGCSSSGLYKIGSKYIGKFGKSYKLTGLEKTNSNALKRAIVLHSYKDIPDHEIYPNPIGNSLGCPMTSYKFFNILSNYIDSSKRPILLYIF
ncbi:MAG TPA: murein L,D-transpeptidase catalytic domain family protein, partial [Flavisolibacter sp.]|nr:murein L,D-transpeptidase catalytic domain family protein [Flavisolibacter sp.]